MDIWFVALYAFYFGMGVMLVLQMYLSALVHGGKRVKWYVLPFTASFGVIIAPAIFLSTAVFYLFDRATGRSALLTDQHDTDRSAPRGAFFVLYGYFIKK